MVDSIHFEDQLRIEGVNFKGFGILPKYVMLDRDLTIEAKTIYAYFCSFAGNGSSTFPGREKILSDLAMSKDAYYKHFKLLTEQGYLTVVQQKQEKNKFSKNIYTLVSNPKKFQNSAPRRSDNVAYSRIRFSGLKAVGYGMIPKAVMIDSRLPIKAKGIYAYFCSFTGAGDSAFPKMEMILHHLRISKDTYYKFYRILCDLNYISVLQRHVDGRLQVNDYYLNDTPNVAQAGRRKVLSFSVQSQDFDAQVPRNQDTASAGQVPKKQDTASAGQVPRNQDTVSGCQVPKKQDAENQDTRKQDAENQDTNINSLNKNNFIINNSLNQQYVTSSGTVPSLSFERVCGGEREGEKANIKKLVIQEMLCSRKLPYSFSQDPHKNAAAMTEAIHFATYWDTYYPNGYADELEQRVYNLFNMALVDMCCWTSEVMLLKGASVSYARVIDRINELGKFKSEHVDLSEISEPAMYNYKRGALNKEIYNPLQYMKSCIWDAMQVGNIGFYEDMRRMGL